MLGTPVSESLKYEIWKWSVRVSQFQCQYKLVQMLVSVESLVLICPKLPCSWFNVRYYMEVIQVTDISMNKAWGYRSVRAKGACSLQWLVLVSAYGQKRCGCGHITCLIVTFIVYSLTWQHSWLYEWHPHSWEVARNSRVHVGQEGGVQARDETREWGNQVRPKLRHVRVHRFFLHLTCKM